MQALRRLLTFLWECKAWWMIPMLLVAALFILLLLESSQTGDSPFIYQLF
jgi:hypothetical protein